MVGAEYAKEKVKVSWGYSRSNTSNSSGIICTGYSGYCHISFSSTTPDYFQRQ